jgi:hypothetical protein
VYKAAVTFVGLEVLTAVVIFWDVKPCSPSKVYRCLGLLHAGFLFALLLNPEDGSAMFVLNVGRLSTGYTELYARK